jgi:drug/metabolite transporter (DMT)-like permease
MAGPMKSNVIHKDGAAYILGGITIVLWSSTSLTVNLAYRWGVSTLQVLTLVTFFAFIFNALAALMGEGVRGFRWTVREWGKLALLGCLGIFVYAGAFYWGFHLGGPVYPLLTNYLWPALLVVISVLRKKNTLRWEAWIGLTLAFGGVVLAICAQYGSASTNPPHVYLGMALGLLAALSWAVFSSYASDLKVKPFSSQTVYNGSGLACFLLLTLWQPVTFDVTWQGFALMAYLGTLVNGLGYVFWLIALRTASPARIAPLVYLCPFLALGLVSLFLNEHIYPLTYLGLVVNIAGVIVATRFAVKKEPI